MDENMSRVARNAKQNAKRARKRVIKDLEGIKNINKGKSKKQKIRNNILIALLGIFIFFFVIGIIFMLYIIIKAPKFDKNNLYQKEASIVYDAKGKSIAALGAEQRELVTYDDLPEVLVDAIVATEDSRFYQHNGVDMARFIKASFSQLIHSGGGGASTLTMQVVKNNFTSTTSQGFAGIVRKFTDVYMSVFKVETHYTKNEIMEFYVNAPYLGSGAYGVEQATRTFFGKSVTNLSLAEAATMAGLFQAPGSYDPLVHPDNAQKRRNTVLDLMVRHKYITKEIADTTKQIPVKTLLKEETNEKVKLNEYQGFVDTVVEEVIKNTGNNPYNTSMEIYTTMDRSKQDAINNFYKGKNYSFVDKQVQVGITAVDTKTGAIKAVGAGRNKTKELSFNYATMTNKHPGSTAKPIVDYGPGIECEKWSTYTPFFDTKTSYSNGTNINNWDRSYKGMLTLKQALADSRNTTALQAFQSTSNECKAKFIKSLGIRAEFGDDDYLHEAHSIGAFTGASPTELASAYAAFASGGYYTKPYSYTKIVYKMDNNTETNKTTRKRVMKEETAYLITDVLKSATKNNPTSSQVATKTGTASYEESALKKRGIPTSAIQSSWVSFYSPSISVTFWYGYPKLSSENYMTMNSASAQRTRIQRVLARGLVDGGEKFSKPSGVVSASVELGTLPASKPSKYTPRNMVQTHLFIKGTQPTSVSSRFSKLEDVTNLKADQTNNRINLTWNEVDSHNYLNKSAVYNYFKNGFKKNADRYYKLLLDYNKKQVGTLEYDIYVNINGNLKKVGTTTKGSYSFIAPNGATEVVVKTTYTRNKATASDGATVKLKETESSSMAQDKVSMSINGTVGTFNIGDTYSDPSDPIKFTLNGETIPSSEYKTSYILSKDGSTFNSSSPLEAGSYTVKYNVTYNGKTYNSSTYGATRSFTVS